MISRRRDKRHRRAVAVPLDVRPFAPAARDVVAERRSMEIGWYLEAHGGPGRRVDHDPVKRGKRLIAGQRIFPRLKFRMANARVDQIHLADVAFVLLKRGDLPGVGRPSQDRTVAPCPASVVGGVAEILDAVFGELGFLAGTHVSHPEIPVANERGLLAVWRRGAGAVGRSRRREPCHFAGGEVAGGLRGGGRVHQPCLGALVAGGAIPEPIVRDPRGAHAAVEDERRRVVRHEPLGACVVVSGQRRWTLLGGDGGGEQDADEERQGASLLGGACVDDTKTSTHSAESTMP